MEDVLNATLAGGVIIGGSADLVLNPAIALIIGSIGGLVSTFCFNKLTPALARKGIYYDTCGVINLHGIPGFLGGIINAIITATLEGDDLGNVHVNDVFHMRKNHNYTANA